jgi:23S rRNA (adenine2503-C2)-methyltransferase
MHHGYGATACVSTQAGCAMACVFCASGQSGFLRDLTADEIAAQVHLMSVNKKITNVVLMGMGEPLANYSETIKFIEIITSPRGRAISQRGITLSTCGLIDGIKRLMNENLKITLAVSLHAPNDAVRTKIMPIARANPYNGLIGVCREYAEKTGRRVTFEYALIKGLNDSLNHAEELAEGIKNGLFHVNVIPLNKATSGFTGSDEIRARKFVSALNARGITATLRTERGADIGGACGQLRLSEQRRDGSLPPEFGNEESE